MTTEQLEHIPTGDLIPYARNSRAHSDQQVTQLAASIHEFGFCAPILIDEASQIIAGHGRVMAAQKLKLETVPCRRLEHLSEAQKRAYVIADNRLAENATWDQELLTNELSDLYADDFDVELLGFEANELESLLGLEPDKAEIVEDEVPEPPADPVTQPGDLWLLGDHRLLCGDSTKAEDVERLMDGAKADLCFTSPPYGQQREYTKEGKEKCEDWDGLMRGVFANLPMTKKGQVLVNLGLIHRDGEWIPYWDNWIEWMREQGWRRFGWYVWDQGPGLPGDWNGRLAPSHEFVFHFNKETKKPVKTKHCKWAGEENHGTGLRDSQNNVAGYCHAGKPVQDMKIPDSVIRVMRHKARGIEVSHPAVFSVPFASEFLSMWPGTTYEPFLGSGTTLIAAEQLNRKCYGMEISPQYCDLIIQRWEKLTGNKATKE